METYNPADHMVMCRKYKQNLPKMPKPPFPNKLGEELQNTVSSQSMERMAKNQTMLINENHLSMIDLRSQKFITEQRNKFLDNEDYERPKAGQRKNK